MNLTNVKNVKLKAQYILDNVDKVRSRFRITSGTLMMINLAKRDGLKCDCCGDNKLHFIINPTNLLVLVSSQIYKNEPTKMTMDHDILKSLSGVDSIENKHLLCSRCNSTRDNKFAEYSEFKQWFHKEKSLGRNPHKTASALVQNYCYVDFKRNLSTLTRIEHLAKGSKFPPFLHKFLIEMYMNNGKFIRAVEGGYNYTNESLLTRYDAEAWNDLLNCLIIKIVEREQKYRIQNPKINFAVYKSYNRKTMTIDDLLEVISHKLKGTVLELGKKAAEERRQKMRQENLAAIERQATTMQQKVQEQHMVVIPAELSMWQKIVKVFKNMIA